MVDAVSIGGGGVTSRVEVVASITGVGVSIDFGKVELAESSTGGGGGVGSGDFGASKLRSEKWYFFSSWKMCASESGTPSSFAEKTMFPTHSALGASVVSTGIEIVKRHSPLEVARGEANARSNPW